MTSGTIQTALAQKDPVLAITMGDAAGIGPEIVVRALTRSETYESCDPIVVGDAQVLAAAVSGMDLDLDIHSVENLKQARFELGAIDVLDLANIDLTRLRIGQVDPMAGGAAVEYVIKAVELAQSGWIDGIVTAPLHKQAMNEAGYDYPGHTELLAEKTGSSDYAMMFVAGNLRTILVTIHCALRSVPDIISREKVLKKIQQASSAMQLLSVENPIIAVAGLNPHAGEGGMFGHEEIEVLEPAIRDARAEGIDVVGPYPADTIYNRLLKGDFDIVVAMYHDQGLIPVKLLGFEKGVNVTLGLPFIRTSVDHGTAFGKAWEWRANPGSLITAILLAARMIREKSRREFATQVRGL
jgi:4-hydroxythreonine-4-phosphate dehydrogenase